MSFGIGNVLATVFSIWSRRFPRLFLLSLLFYVPVFAWMAVSMTDRGRMWLMENWYMRVYEIHPALSGNASSGHFLIYAMLIAAVTHTTLSVLIGERTSIGAAAKRGLTRAPRTIVIALIVRGATTWLPLAVAVMIWGERLWWFAGELAIYTYLALYVLLESLFVAAIPICAWERAGIFASLRRNFALARGQRIKIFGLVLLQHVLVWLVFRLLFEFMMPAGWDTDARVQLWNYAMLVIEVVFASLTGVMSAVIYERLRESKEGMRVAVLDKVFE